MKNAVQFGAGNIGRGFIGALLSKSGYNVVFADINSEVIDKINNDKQYTINIKDINCTQEIIKNVSGIMTGSDDMIQKIKEADIITTAVGPVVLSKISGIIAKGIKTRFEANINKYLNIIACENAINASSSLKEYIIPHLNDREIDYLDKYVGFPNCSVDRIVPPFVSENIIDVACESFFEWNVENAFKGDIPAIDGMNIVKNLLQYIERKLFTLNTGHAITAYLGHLKGYKTIDEAINDEKIYNLVKSAMMESGKALICKYGFDEDNHIKYIDKIIARFKNPYLSDDIARVCREPLRKLSENDRLIKPLKTAKSYNIDVKCLLIGIGATLRYSNISDEQSVTLQKMIAEKGIKNTVSEVSNMEIGSDIDILDDIQIAYEKVLQLI